MPRTKTKPKVKPNPPTPAMNGATADVLTLAEAAAYLRLPESEVVSLVHTQGLPGRAVGKEWRFLKTALQDWLRATPPTGPSKEGLLALAGAWKDDPGLDDIKEAFQKNRGRPMFEDE
jgi:excisionase family DNA binding protein